MLQGKWLTITRRCEGIYGQYRVGNAWLQRGGLYLIPVGDA